MTSQQRDPIDNIKALLEGEPTATPPSSPRLSSHAPAKKTVAAAQSAESKIVKPRRGAVSVFRQRPGTAPPTLSKAVSPPLPPSVPDCEHAKDPLDALLESLEHTVGPLGVPPAKSKPKADTLDKVLADMGTPASLLFPGFVRAK